MELKSDEVMDRTYIITLKSNNKSDNISSVKIFSSSIVLSS